MNDKELQKIADELFHKGWIVCDALMPHKLCLGLHERALVHEKSGVMRAAAIGQGINRQQREDIRRDSIYWLQEASEDPSEQCFLSFMDELRRGLSRELFLAVRSYEAHFACYQSGAFYQRHLDRFQDNNHREISTVLFLNPDWQEIDAGHLRIDSPSEADQGPIDILPVFGRLVIFRSATIPHEVLAPKRTRYSIAGWMRSDS